MRKNTNSAPFPHPLASLVRDCKYRPGWVIELEHLDRGQGSEGLTLTITTLTVDSYHPERPMRVHHFFPVPPAAYDWRSWQRWLFEQFRLVELHEAMEFFQIDGERPFAPNHGPGRDPYTVLEVGSREDVDTSFRGYRNHP